MAFLEAWSEPGPLAAQAGRAVLGEPATAIPARVAAAFEARPPSEIEARLLGALNRHPGATAAELSAACGWAAPTWQTHFRLMCQRRQEWLWPPGSGASEAPFVTGVLADYDAESGRFTLRPEAAQALARM